MRDDQNTGGAGGTHAAVLSTRSIRHFKGRPLTAIASLAPAHPAPAVRDHGWRRDPTDSADARAWRSRRLTRRAPRTTWQRRRGADGQGGQAMPDGTVPEPGAGTASSCERHPLRIAGVPPPSAAWTRECPPSRFCVHDDVGHVRLCVADVILEPARQFVRVGQPALRAGDD
jgi:hypothetical protein